MTESKPSTASENKSYNSVADFHRAFNHPVGETPRAIPAKTALKRAVWSGEELVEFLHASVRGNQSQFDEIMFAFLEGIEAAYQKSSKVGEISTSEVLTAQMDALTDISYFNYGSFVVAGVDPQPLFDIVQDANMAKLGPDGKPIIRESDGKIMKPEGWVAPEPLLDAEIKRQIDNAKK